MKTVTVSSRFQVVIPKPCESGWASIAGDRLQVLSFDNRLEFVQVRPMREMRGFPARPRCDVCRDEMIAFEHWELP